MQDWHRRYEMSSVSKIKTPTKIEKKMRSSIPLRQLFLGRGGGGGGGGRGDVVIRHNHLRDVVVELCHSAHWSVGVEEGHGPHKRSQPCSARQLMCLLLGGTKESQTPQWHSHSPLPSWVNQANWLVQLPLQQRPASSSHMDPNVRSWGGPTSLWQWKPMRIGSKRPSQDCT